jgi:hypothetical protein
MLDSQDKKELAEVERALNDTFVYDDYGKNSPNKCSICPFPICREPHRKNHKCWF